MMEPLHIIRERQQRLARQQEVFERMRRRGLTPPVDWKAVERRRMKYLQPDEPEQHGGAIRGAIIAVAIEVVIVLVILGVWAALP